MSGCIIFQYLSFCFWLCLVWGSTGKRPLPLCYFCHANKFSVDYVVDYDSRGAGNRGWRDRQLCVSLTLTRQECLSELRPCIRWVITSDIVTPQEKNKWSQALSVTWSASAIAGPLLGGVFSVYRNL